LPPLNLYARVRYFYHFAHETAGAARTRLSLRPPFSRDNVFAQLGCYPRREKAKPHLDAAIARSACDEAIHGSSFAALWIASLALAMTVGADWLFEK
jgi:hypothetical protein